MDGRTLREHLQSLQRQTGAIPPALRDAPRCPEGCDQLWSDFLTLHHARGSSGVGPLRISYTDIDAFERVMRMQFEPWQIDAIRAADTAFLTQHSEGSNG